jgi:hypothetical protein
MTHDAVHSILVVFVAFAGLLFGLLYFAALKRSVTMLAGGKGWLGPLTLTLGRIGAAAGFLLVAAKLGAEPLLAAFVGFLVARALTLRLERRAG